MGLCDKSRIRSDKEVLKLRQRLEIAFGPISLDRNFSHSSPVRPVAAANGTESFSASSSAPPANDIKGPPLALKSASGSFDVSLSLFLCFAKAKAEPAANIEFETSPDSFTLEIEDSPNLLSIPDI